MQNINQKIPQSAAVPMEELFSQQCIYESVFTRVITHTHVHIQTPTQSDLLFSFEKI